MGAPAPPAGQRNSSTHPPQPRSPTSSSASLTSEASPHTSDQSPTASPTRSSPSTPSPSPPLQPPLTTHQKPIRLPPPPSAAPNPPGLFNLGNTCYLNSVVQVLYHIPTFRISLLRYSPRHHQPTHSHSFACELACALKQVFHNLDDAYTAATTQNPKPHPVLDSFVTLPPYRPNTSYSSKDQNQNDDLLRENIDYVAPQHIINLLRDHERCLEFDARGQQDAHEFLRFLLDKVNDCMQMDNDEHFPLPPQTAQSHHSSNSCTYPSLPPDVPPLHTSSSKSTANKFYLPHANGGLRSNRPNHSALHPSPPPTRSNTHDQPNAYTHRPTESSAAKHTAPHESTIPIPSKPTGDQQQTPAEDSAHKSPANKRRRFETSSPRENPTEPQPSKQDLQPDLRVLTVPLSRSQQNDRASCLPPPDSPVTNKPIVNGRVAGEEHSSPSNVYRRTAERRRTKRYRRNLVSDLFQGRAVTATRCYECESHSHRCENFLDVSLPVEHGKSLSWALSTQCIEEQLFGSNKYYCSNCKTYTEAKRWWQVASLPEVLTVHLKLFAYGSRFTGIGGKVSVAMPCPVRTKLSQWCEADCIERDDEYLLTAVIVHEGTGASSGHYYSYIRKQDQDQQWYCFDDSFVTAVSEDEVRQRLFTSMKTKRTAYLLFYSNAEDLKTHSQQWALAG